MGKCELIKIVLASRWLSETEQAEIINRIATGEMTTEDIDELIKNI